MQYALFYIDFFVNNIQKNHHLTALNGDFIIVCVTFLIMPFIGLSPFLLESPFIGYLSMILCQCPLSGFLHFYALNFIFDKKKKYSVNALYRAFSISTVMSIDLTVLSKCVSMPFIGLSPFLLALLILI